MRLNSKNYMYKIVLLFLVQWICFSCKDISNCDKLPSIVIEGNPDTIRFGELYSAKMYLSDSCFFFVKEIDSYLIPIMIVNNEEVKVNKGNWANVAFLVKGDSTQTKKYAIEYWDAEIVFPHPKGGDIRLSSRIEYVVENFHH